MDFPLSSHPEPKIYSALFTIDAKNSPTIISILDNQLSTSFGHSNNNGGNKVVLLASKPLSRMTNIRT